MGRWRWDADMKQWMNRFQMQAALLLAVVLLDGALLGAVAGVMHGGDGNQAAEVQNQAAAVRDQHILRDEGAKDPGFLKTQEQFAETGKKPIALTFDDGPHGVHTAALLDGLKERGVQASFFLMGENIGGNEDLVRRMQAEGHLIGNHSFRHLRLTKEGEDAVCEAVEQTEAIIQGITGSRSQYLRPPYGDWNENLECRIDLTTVLWTVDSLDWKLQNTSRIVRRIEKEVEAGDIILMHDIFPSSVTAALQVIDDLQARGYVFVTVDELLID